jgi:hypothetical protein
VCAYQWLGGGAVAESGASRLDVGRELRFVERFFGGRGVLLWDNVIDGLFHLLLFFIYSSQKYN